MYWKCKCTDNTKTSQIFNHLETPPSRWRHLSPPATCPPLCSCVVLSSTFYLLPLLSPRWWDGCYRLRLCGHLDQVYYRYLSNKTIAQIASSATLVGSTRAGLPKIPVFHISQLLAVKWWPVCWSGLFTFYILELWFN